MLAAAYPDDEERGSAIGIAMGTTALGVLGNIHNFQPDKRFHIMVAFFSNKQRTLLRDLFSCCFSAGPPFGGLFYSLAGKGLPFFILAGIIFITFG